MLEHATLKFLVDTRSRFNVCKTSKRRCVSTGLRFKKSTNAKFRFPFHIKAMKVREDDICKRFLEIISYEFKVKMIKVLENESIVVKF